MRLRRFLSLVLAALLTVGCVNMSSELTIRPDGSGTLNERLTVSPQFAQMMRDMQEMGDSTGASDELFSKDDVQSRADTITGLQLDSVEMLSGPEGEGYEAVYTFDDLNAVQFDASPDDMLPDQPQNERDDEAPFDLLSDVEFSHTAGPPATLTITMPRSGEEEIGMDTPGEGPPSDQEMKMMRHMMRDMGFRLAVTVDGDILETNASHRSASTITLMEMNFGELAQDSTAFRKLMLGDDQAVSSRAAIDSLNALSGIAIEPEETVTIRYQ